eukprot:TRINITY_DN1620_c0_g2_i1.p1 TRINITY_DN1620_c0_g2~~TRINITY_DN1620_c0_g2_i1.p1  ORF type:complete len:1025 (-),score=271.61 TRINITY_DN1620_c0_g2_i1:66-3068(-)
MRLCGLYSSTDAPVPLEGVHVEAKIVDMVAEVNVLQFYANTESFPIEAKYIFPLDANSAVCDFQADINGKIIQGKVKEKQQAKAEYNAAIKRGDGAYLLEQEKADIFQVSVGNIPASTRVNIKITYVVELESDGDYVRFTLPTTIAPRYTPAGKTTTTYSTSYTTHTLYDYVYLPYYKPWYDCWCDCGFHWRRYRHRLVERTYTTAHTHAHTTYTPDPSATQVIAQVNASQRREVPYALSMYLQLEMPSEIEEVVSATHGIQNTKESAKIANVMFVRDNEAMDKDVVVKIRTKDGHQPRAVLEEGDLVEGGTNIGRAAMVTLVPQFVLNDINAEFIFIVDRSGSMSGAKMNQTKNALDLFLRALPANCYFNIVGFGSSFQKLFSNGSQPYTEQNVAAADAHIRTMSANLGGTELMGPLREVYSQRSIQGYSRQIFVLTDGEVSNTEEVVRLVVENHKRNNDWRLFTIGVGSSVSHALVEGMARGGRGTVQIIGDGERLEPKVMAQLKQALQPALTNVQVDWGVTSTPVATPASTPPTSFGISAPKVGCLIGHRVNEQKPAANTAVRNDLVYQAPYNVPPIYSGKRFIVYAFLHPTAIPQQIVIKADSPDGPLNLTLPLERTTGATVQRLAARSLIRDLEEGTSHLHNQPFRPEESRVKQEIINLGVKYSLVSKHTSFVAIEDRADERSNWFFAPPPVQPVTRNVTQMAPAAPAYAAYAPYSAPVPAGFFGGFGGRGGGAMGYGAPPPPGCPAPRGPPMMAQSAAPSYNSAMPMSRSSSLSSGYRMQESAAAPPRPSTVNYLSSDTSEKRKKGFARKESASDSFADLMECEDDGGSSLDFLSMGSPQIHHMAQPQQQTQSLFGFAAPSAPMAPLSSASSSFSSNDPRANLMILLKLQKIDGSFEASPALASSLRLALSELTNIGSSGVALPNTPEGVKVWTTALVLAFLNGIYAALKDDWELVADKSKSWLTKQLRAFGASTSADDIVLRATSTLNAAGIF